MNEQQAQSIVNLLGKLTDNRLSLWTNILTGIIAVISLSSALIAWWGIKKQAALLQTSVLVDNLLKLEERFTSESFKSKRHLAATDLLGKSEDGQSEDVFDFFETVGLLLRRKILDEETVHSTFFHWINLYWLAGQECIQQMRRDGRPVYSDFEDLYKKVHEFEKKKDPKSGDLKPTPEVLDEYLEEELS